MGRSNEAGRTASAAVLDSGHGQQDGRPAGEDVGAEQGDAEDQATEQVAGAGQVEEGLQAADVAGRGSAAGGDDDVVDEGWGLVGQRGQERNSHDFGGEHHEVAEGEHEEAEEAEHPHLADLVQVHAGEAREREDGHDGLGGAADHPLVRVCHEAVEGGVADLDGDEDRAGDRCGDAGGLGEAGGGDGHGLLLGSCRPVCRR